MFLRTPDLYALLVQAILLTAASYLLTLYTTSPEILGPFKIFFWIRSRAGIRPVVMTDVDTGEEEIIDYQHDGQFFAQLLSCHRCFSPYSAAGLIVLSWLIGFVEPDLTNIILWLAVAGATVYLLE